jgi:hypothetical protein
LDVIGGMGAQRCRGNDQNGPTETENPHKEIYTAVFPMVVLFFGRAERS